MIRDTIKEESYFNSFLEYENERIEKFTSLAHSVINQRGEDDIGVKRAYISLQGFYFNKLRALYSSGASLEEIKEFFPEVINIMEKTWSANSGYVQMLWMVSIGIMLDVPNNDFRKLETMIEREGLQDYLIDFLIQPKNEDWKEVSPNFAFNLPYQFLKSVITTSDKSEATALLKNYLQNEWYEGHNDTGWYDTHKSSNDTYSGYWSFESGALAKILNLDDSTLKNIPYYPYDMVHYGEN
ncbi:DUF1911 domain-containing protein [Bacillus aerolatus]|uniref:DUF1911 domain-containing protein n=1 Tax=Bacillus aerolatus TaxID=2653354 RepID=A0A6I1FHN7_9BACI|nr:PoNi-like cognate immunity protein [Bacillus aerolatus]KAB7705327.1 DUF1911 domain-containing protein [Bacillus aerolatus]